MGSNTRRCAAQVRAAHPGSHRLRNVHANIPNRRDDTKARLEGLLRARALKPTWILECIQGDGQAINTTQSCASIVNDQYTRKSLSPFHS